MKTRMSVGRCCCSGCSGAVRVLLWEIDSNPGPFNFQACQDAYTGMGVVSEFSTQWTGTLDDYGLIIWPTASSDPSWWSQITSGSWGGRLCMTAEYNFFTATRNYVNSKSSLHGMTVANDSSAGNPDFGIAAAHQLTANQGLLNMAATASVSGGTTVYTSNFLSRPMIQQVKAGTVDWVISGDSNPFTETRAELNKDFLCNLANKPIP